MSKTRIIPNNFIINQGCSMRIKAKKSINTRIFLEIQRVFKGELFSTLGG
ncbi:hypothetical protein JW877_01675 [bacterium]|nr:hypothetical protein [bacterium]